MPKSRPPSTGHCRPTTTATNSPGQGSAPAPSWFSCSSEAARNPRPSSENLLKLDRQFGEFLALALAIHCRDEVAVQQFIKSIASDVVNRHEEDEEQQARTRRPGRSDARLEEMMADHMKILGALADRSGMEWLRTQLHS